MADSRFFNTPFGASGDRATIPEAADPSGAVSYAQGFGPDYERDPATDPLAKRVPRDETNEYLYQITNALKYLQLYGLPEWYDEDAAGNPVAYPQGAQVRHDSGSGMTAWLSIAAANTAEPGTDATKWVLASGYSWQHISAAISAAGLTPDPASTGQLATVLTGKVSKSGDTMSGPLNMGSSRVINLADAASQYDAVNLGQLRQAGLQHGTAVYSTPGSHTFTAPQAGWYWVEAYGGGGGAANSNGSGEGGGGGGYAGKWVQLSAGEAVPVTVGAAGITDGSGSGDGTSGGASGAAGIQATGGGGATFTGSPGFGGNGTGGDINLEGQSGMDGNSSSFPLAGIGGDAAGPLGGKGAQLANKATWPGGGGSRAGVWNANGAPGSVIIRY